MVKHDRPVLDQINLVVSDMDAMIEFYRRLGVEIASTEPPWDQHHRTLGTPGGLDFDLEPPYDAFWGARYAVLADPDGNAVGIMSAADPQLRTKPPAPSQ